MNEPLPAGVSRPANRSDYIPIIQGLRPFVEGEELELRCSLMLMRDRAIATKLIAKDPAWTLLDVVQREASEHAMNWRLGIEDLREIRRLCVMCVCNASSFDTFYRASDEGEANAGG